MNLIGGMAFIGDATRISFDGMNSVQIVDEDGMPVVIDLLTLVRALDVAKVDCQIRGLSFTDIVERLQARANEKMRREQQRG